MKEKKQMSKEYYIETDDEKSPFIAINFKKLDLREFTPFRITPVKQVSREEFIKRYPDAST